MRLLTPAVRALEALPRWALWAVVGGLLVQAPVRWPGGTLLVRAAALGSLVAILGAVVLAAWAERRGYQKFRSRPAWARLLGALSIVLVGPLLGLALALVAALLLGATGLPSEWTAAPLLAGLWMSSAAVGTTILLLVDLGVSALVADFRARIVAAVLTLTGIAGLVLVGGVTVITGLFEQATSGGSTGRIEVSLGGGKAIPLEELAGDYYHYALTLGLLGLLLLLALPAVLSAVTKLADSVTERLEPMKVAFDALAAGDRDLRLEAGGSRDFVELAQHFNDMVARLELGERMERAFGSYVSGQLLTRIREQHGHAALPADLREATVLFADVRGFTAMSERLAPDAVLAVMNRWFGRVIEVVELRQGYLNKFIGDAVMIVFNGPVSQPDHALRAVDCACALARAVEEMNAAEAFPEVGRLDVGIGVSTGPMISGNVGSVRQMEYTVLGDAVNLASRLTGRAPAGEVWVGEQTAAAVEGSLELEPLEPIQVKGKVQPVRAYRAWPVARVSQSAG